MSTTALYEELVTRLREQVDIASCLALLDWDQETYLPPGAQASRSAQIGTLARVLHERQTDPRFLELIDTIATRIDELEPDAATDVRETKWRSDRKRALSTQLVSERSRLHSQAKAVWIEARRKNDFALLAPYLEQVVRIEREVAQTIDPSRAPYDALLEEYERGASSHRLLSLFEELRGTLQRLMPRITDRAAAPPPSALLGSFTVDRQRELNCLLAARMGFDFSRGRLDESVHPFTTTIGEDVRITTRYDSHDLRTSLYSTIHETGHALYEQGLRADRRGLPSGDSCSLGVHESQSRLWENLIGRSEAFWRFLFPLAAEQFPDLRSRAIDDVVRAVNDLRPSLIRTEADEVTYNLHIVLRFELERELIGGSLRVVDLPQAWREKMTAYLGIAPSTDREGVLQDVHWPSGAIGYFPTYTLGNIYAAQLLEAATRDLGPIDEMVAAGEFATLLHWLRERVHRHGQTYTPSELIKRATGEPPRPDALCRHLERKVAFVLGGSP